MPKRDEAHMTAQRERIMRAAVRCIAELGIERTSIAEIRRESGLSAGAIYKHFANKDAIIAETLRFAAMKELDTPASWAELRDDIARLGEQAGFDVATVARADLQLLSSGIRPGPLHDQLKPVQQQALAVLAGRLAEMRDAGLVRLRLTPDQTALGISALAGGLLWFGMMIDRPMTAISADIAAALDCLIEPGSGRP